DNPLPVELLSFTATSTIQGVKLAWETASETESNGFTILRRPQGESNWTEVASYQTTNELRAQNALNGASYSYTDHTHLEVGKVYEYQLRETGFDGQVATLQTLSLTIRFNTARAFELAQNYPNPFNPTTTIRYQIPTAQTVSLKVYDVLGKEVATLVNGRQEAGSYSVPFNASRLSSGMYFYRLQAGEYVETRKMMLVK
ncbi:MAG: T9SS type A sorting domain-containing protein, partial [Chloroherpetonaceae bacterium]